MPFWTVILLAGRMAIPQELYEAAEVDGATGLTRFTHVTFPLLANLYLVCTLLSTIFTLGDFNSVYLRLGRRAGAFHPCAGHARHPRCLRGRAARARRGGRADGAAAHDPAGADPDAQAAHDRGDAVTVAVDDAGLAVAGRRAGIGGARAARAAASLVERGGSAGHRRPGADLDAGSGLQHLHGVARVEGRRVHRNDLARRNRRLDSFWIVITQGYWYLEAFLAPVRQQLLYRRRHGVLHPGDRLAGELRDRPHAHSLRLAAQQRGAADLCDPRLVPGNSLLSDHADLRPDQQSVVGDRRRGHLRDALRDLHLPAVRHAAFRSSSTRRRGSTGPRPSRCTGRSTCR